MLVRELVYCDEDAGRARAQVVRERLRSAISSIGVVRSDDGERCIKPGEVLFIVLSEARIAGGNQVEQSVAGIVGARPELQHRLVRELDVEVLRDGAHQIIRALVKDQVVVVVANRGFLSGTSLQL